MPSRNLKQAKNNIKEIVRFVLKGFIAQVWSLVPRGFYLGKSPMRLLLATTRICNANCVFCAYQFAREEDKIHMPDQIFSLVLDQIRRANIKFVMLAPNVGEPLAAPQFIEKVKHLRAAGVKEVAVTTNAILLYKIGLQKMLSDGPDVINISFAGFDKEMYERDFRAGHYERTRENILKLLRMNKSLGSPKIINFRLRGDLSADKLLSAPEMDEVRLLASDVNIMTEVDSWLGLITEEILPAGYVLQSDSPKISRRPCSQLFDLTVHPDGNIHLCSCRNVFGDPDLDIGNIKEISLLEAHRKIPKVLSKWESGNVPATCQTCSMYCDPALGLLGRWKEMRKWARALPAREKLADEERIPGQVSEVIGPPPQIAPKSMKRWQIKSFG